MVVVSCAVTFTSMMLGPTLRAKAPLGVALVMLVKAPPFTRASSVAFAWARVAVTVTEEVAFGTLGVL